MQIEGLLMIDVYRDRIAIQQNGRWYWADLTSGLVAVARPDRPNRHYAICCPGQFGHAVPNPSRFLLIGSKLADGDATKTDIEKFGFFKTVDPNEDVA